MYIYSVKRNESIILSIAGHELGATFVGEPVSDTVWLWFPGTDVGFLERHNELLTHFTNESHITAPNVRTTAGGIIL